MKLDMSIVEAKDFAIYVKNLPSEESEEDIKSFFESFIPDVKIAVAKVCMAYKNVRRYLRLKEEKIYELIRQANMLEKAKHNQKVDQNKLLRIEEKINRIDNALDEYEAKTLKKDGGLFSGDAFISFEREEGKSGTFLRYIHIKLLFSELKAFWL